MPGSVVANSIAIELRLGPAVCTDPAQSRLAYPGASDVLAVTVSANRVEAPVILFPLVAVVFGFLRFLALVAGAPVHLRFGTVSSSISMGFRFLSSCAPSVLVCRPCPMISVVACLCGMSLRCTCVRGSASFARMTLVM